MANDSLPFISFDDRAIFKTNQIKYQAGYKQEDYIKVQNPSSNLPIDYYIPKRFLNIIKKAKDKGIRVTVGNSWSFQIPALNKMISTELGAGYQVEKTEEQDEYYQRNYYQSSKGNNRNRQTPDKVFENALTQYAIGNVLQKEFAENGESFQMRYHFDSFDLEKLPQDVVKNLNENIDDILSSTKASLKFIGGERGEAKCLITIEGKSGAKYEIPTNYGQCTYNIDVEYRWADQNRSSCRQVLKGTDFWVRENIKNIRCETENMQKLINAEAAVIDRCEQMQDCFLGVTQKDLSILTSQLGDIFRELDINKLKENLRADDKFDFYPPYFVAMSKLK